MAKNKTEGVGRAWIRALRTEPLARLYIMYGEETYRRETAVGMIRRRLSPESGFDWDTVELRGRGVTPDEIAEAVSTPPLSAERKLVVVREFDPIKNDISELASSLPEDVCLIFDMDDPAWRPDKRTKAYREIAKYGIFAEFNEAAPEELAGFVRRCFSDRGHTIDRPEIEYLTFLCTPLMAGLLNEIEKISTYAKGKQITREDIDAVASRAVESRIFELCDELAAGRTGRALLMLADLETAREPAVAVAAVIARQFRQLYAARLAMEAGRGRNAVMELCGLRYESHASRLMSAARRIPLPLLRDALIACMEADAALKSSRAGDYDVLRMLLMRYGAKAAEV